MLILVSILATGCTSGGAGASAGDGSISQSPAGPRPASTANLRILSPRNGEEVQGGVVSLRVSLEDAKLVPATTTDIRPDRGHLHVFLDDTLVTMTSGLSQRIHGVGPGSHLLQVEFVASDHAPFDPRVIQQVTFEVHG